MPGEAIAKLSLEDQVSIYAEIVKRERSEILANLLLKYPPLRLGRIVDR